MSEVIYCEHVPKRQSDYENKLLTQQSLIDLGKILQVREKDAYLMSMVKELNEFDGNVFMTEYERSNDKNILMAKSYNLIRYISIFKELHNTNVEEIKSLKSQIETLNSTISDQSEQIDSYITQIPK